MPGATPLIVLSEIRPTPTRVNATSTKAYGRLSSDDQYNC